MRKILILLLLTSFIGNTGLQASYKKALNQYYIGKYENSLTTLKTVSSKKKPEKHVLKALCLMNLNQPKKALQSLNSYKPNQFEIPYITYLNGILNIKTDNLKKVMAADHKIQQSVIKPFLIQTLRLEMMKYHRKKKNWNRVNSLIKSSLVNQENSFLTSKVLIEEIKLKAEQRKRGDTLELYSQLLSKHPESEPQKKLWKKIQKTFDFTANFYTNFNSIEDHLKYNQNTLRTLKYKDVIKHHKYIIKAYKRHPILYRFYFNKAVAYFHLGKYNLAAREFNRHVEPYMNKQDPDYLVLKYYTGKALELTGENKLALEQYKEIINFGPSIYYSEALYLSIILAEKTNLQKYNELFKPFYKTEHNKPFYNQYIWEKQWKELNDHEPIETDRILKTLVKPTVKIRLANWYKNLYPRLKTLDANTVGIESYPISYKAQQAILGLRNKLSPKIELNTNLDKQIDRLCYLGFRALVIKELTFDANQPSTSHIDTIYQLAKLYTASGEQKKSIQIIKKGLELLSISRTEILEPFLRLMYPKLYWKEITKYANKYHIDPYLILAIIRESSFFDTHKKGFKNRRGLFQFNPEIGKKLAIRKGQFWQGPQTLESPETSINLGTFYLSWLKQQFGPDLHYSLAALHAGTQTARVWISQNRDYRFTNFKESIPYIDTRDFMQRVLDSYIIYKLVDDPTINNK